jgi:hypothetical protein
MSHGLPNPPITWLLQYRKIIENCEAAADNWIGLLGGTVNGETEGEEKTLDLKLEEVDRLVIIIFLFFGGMKTHYG